MQSIAYLDCHSGIRGDMLLGALLDAGLPLDALNQYLTTLPIKGLHIQREPVSAAGLPGTRLQLTFLDQEQPVGSIADIDHQLSTPPFSVRTRDIALTALRRLLDAQATIHHTSSEATVHDKIVTARDCIEIIGTAVGLEALGITDLYTSPLPLATGSTPTAQGPQPNPAPVTLELLRHVNAPWQPCASEAELVTPGVAAILATQAHFATPTLTIGRVGYGYSHACPQGCLRLYLGHIHPSPTPSSGEADTDWVAVIESHIDNMSGELLGGLMERLFTLGALDVSYTPIQMKKNRPATKVTVICPPDQGESLSLVLLRETSTLGVRLQQVQRLKAQRTQQRITTPLGEVLVKVKRLGGRVISAAPEYEECQRIANTQHIPLSDVYAIVQRSIQKDIISMQD
jgi:uncharacterized protein (TIGR00299 family) protein